MEFVLLDDDAKKLFFDEMHRLMTLSDKEFVPPLSSRGSTTQKNLKDSLQGNGCGILAYLTEMTKQQILAAEEDGKLMGFVSYKEDYTNDVISNDFLPNIYLSTLVLNPDARGKGLTKKMYAHLFDELYANRNILTRTWSTNVAHTKILSFFDFEELERLVDDRGEGIDTVYFLKRRT